MFDEGERIIISECARHGVPTGLVKSRRRWAHVVRCRKDIVGRLRRETTLSWREIGYLLGRDGKVFRGAERPVPRR